MKPLLRSEASGTKVQLWAAVMHHSMAAALNPLGLAGLQDRTGLGWRRAEVTPRGSPASEPTGGSPHAWHMQPLASLPIDTLHGGLSGKARGKGAAADGPAGGRSSFLHRAPLMQNSLEISSWT